jgi:CheY-like chemotaxis protein/HPt (histidine-containing phosphotransfer) domain-containing protein
MKDTLFSDIFDNLSHELMTPLNGIIGLTYLAKNSGSIEEKNSYISNIQEASQKLLEVISDLLDYSSLKGNNLTLAKYSFSLDNLMKNIELVIVPQAKEKKLQFQIAVDQSLPERFIGDGVRLRQILFNLLSNAVRFTESGEITLDVKQLSGNGEIAELIFQIRDTGIGISPEDLSGLFSPFSQIDNSKSRRYSGTGLGLAISDHLAKLMGGRIFVESSLGKGSSFNLSLPLEIDYGIKPDYDVEAQEPACLCALEETPEESPEKLERARILVVDDIIMNQEISREILEKAGAVVETAQNGLEALEKINRQQFDLILMDLQMPEMDGYQATQAIREKFDFSQLPIIAFTAHASREDQHKCLGLKMNDYLAKPFKPDNLLKIISYWLPDKIINRQPTENDLQEPELPPMLPGIDVLEGLEFFDGDTSLYLDIVEKFYQNNINLPEKINKAFEEKEHEVLSCTIHALKGSSGNIGASKTMSLSRELEDELRHNSLSRERLNQLSEEIYLVLESAKTMLDKRKNNN